MRAFFAQIERVNPHVNAIVTLRPADELLAEAAAADRRLAAGEAGRRAARPADRDQGPEPHARAAHDVRLDAVSQLRADVGRALRRRVCARAGAIVIGKTNTPEFGAGLADVQRVVRRHAQSVRPDEDLRRQQRRSGRRARVRHAAARRRHRSRRLVAQPRELLQRRRLQAVAGARAAALSREPATRSACTARWRAASTISRCCCRSWQGPIARDSLSLPEPGAAFRDVPRARLRGVRRRLERTARPLSRASLPSRPSATPRGSVFAAARLRRRRRRARPRRRRRAVPNAARGRLCGRARAATSSAAARSSRTRSSGTSSKDSSSRRPISSARRACKAALDAPRRGVLLDARVSRAADGASAAVSRRDRMGARDRGRADAHLRRLDGDLLRDQLLRAAGDQRAVRVLAGGLARRAADRRAPGRDLDVLSLARAFEQATRCAEAGRPARRSMPCRTSIWPPLDAAPTCSRHPWRQKKARREAGRVRGKPSGARISETCVTVSSPTIRKDL